MNNVQNNGAFSRVELINPTDCAELLEELQRLPEHFWYPGGKRIGTPSFSWLEQRSIPSSLVGYIARLSPRAPTWVPRGVMIRRYDPGQGATVGSHVATGAIVVQVPLQSSRDGVTVCGKFFQDVAGVGTITYDVGPILEVPPVEKTRYELIYLFDEQPEYR